MSSRESAESTPGVASQVGVSPMRAARSIAKREVVGFLRQRSRVMASVMTPLLFWVFLGLGIGSSFKASGGHEGNYSSYFFPGVVVLALVFAGIFQTITTIQDRQSGFLQSVLVAPIPRWAIVLGKMKGATLLALLQGILILPLGLASGIVFTPMSFVESVCVLAVVAFMMTGLGFFFAWRLDSIQGFHAVMNLVLMPMWAMSGAFFPAGGAPKAFGWIMHANPLTYGLAALRRSLHPGQEFTDIPSFWLSIAVCFGFGLLMLLLSSQAIKKRRG
jgi:ABC-2 type transport system permease protein